MGSAVAEIGRIGEVAQGTVGVASMHLETGRTLRLHADEFFPMASTVKIAVAAVILDVVDSGEVSLASQIPVARSEMTPGGPLGSVRWRPGLEFSIADLITCMITESDNTAADVLYRVAGGPSAVRAYLRALGVKDMYPARYMRELLRDVWSIPAPPSPETSLVDQCRRTASKKAPVCRSEARRKHPEYDADPRDQATPDAMVELLHKIWAEDGVSGTTRSVLLDNMEKSATGLKRIQGRLPTGSVVADKTGTLAGTTNDVGFITLPDDRGHIALAIVMKGSTAPSVTRERVIADIARLIYDYFLILAP